MLDDHWLRHSYILRFFSFFLLLSQNRRNGRHCPSSAQKLYDKVSIDMPRPFLQISFLVNYACHGQFLIANQDIVDGDMNELHEESDKSHDEEANTRCSCSHREFLTIRFRALFYQMNRIFGKLTKWLYQYFIESLLFGRCRRRCHVLMIILSFFKLLGRR